MTPLLANLAKARVSMRQVTVHTAKRQLSRLIEAALSGEEVVITKGDKPVVLLVPIRRGEFKLGVLPPDALGQVPDFLTPMDEDELRAWEGRS